MNGRAPLKLLVIFLLVVLTATAPVVADHSDDRAEDGEEDEWSDGPGEADEWDQYGINETLYYDLWSGDVDDGEFDHDPPADGMNRSAQYAATYDEPFDEPPRAVEVWNDGEHRNFERVLSDDTTYAPTDVEPVTKSPLIKDAYVDAFAWTPASVVRHESGEDTTTFVPQDGQIQHVVDYRISEGDIEDTDAFEREVVKGVTDAEVDTRLRNPTFDETYGTGEGQLGETPYEGLPASRDFVLEAEISVTATVENWPCTNVTVTSGTPRCSGVYDSENETTTTRSYSVTVTRDLNVQSEALGGDTTVNKFQYKFVEVPKTSLPQHPIGVYISPSSDTEWRKATISNGRGFSNVWAYYSARDTDWDDNNRYSSGGDEQISSENHPLQLHAYPKDTSVSGIPDQTAAEVRSQVSRTEVQSPSLGEEVSLTVAGGEDTYYPPDAVSVQFYTAPRNADSRVKGTTLTTYGLTRTSTETVQISEPLPKLQPTNMTIVDRTETDDGDVRVTFRLTNESTGEGIYIPEEPESEVLLLTQLQQRGGSVDEYPYGYVRISSTDYVHNTTTNETGYGTVTVPKATLTQGLTVRFVPQDWYQTQLGESAASSYLQGSEDTVVKSQLVAVLIDSMALVVVLYGVYVLMAYTSRAMPFTDPLPYDVRELESVKRFFRN